MCGEVARCQAYEGFCPLKPSSSGIFGGAYEGFLAAG